MSVVVDCSVALKWVLPEDDRDAALALLREETFLAPDFLVLECANVLVMKARRGLMTDTQSHAGLRFITNMQSLQLRPSRPHMETAHALALELGQTAYDCLYLALALSEARLLITADNRFATAIQQHGVYASQIRRLA